MTERPILFSTPMVQATIAEIKTETRRLVKNSALQWLQEGFTPEYIADPGNVSLCPYGKAGDRLWVRETWTHVEDDREAYIYKADFGPEPVAWNWKPSIFMPKDACRIWLEVKSIRIERLQDISDESCIAEGIEPIEPGSGIFKDYTGDRYYGSGRFGLRRTSFVLPKESYKSLWTLINGSKSWDSNPWVWVVGYSLTFNKTITSK